MYGKYNRFFILLKSDECMRVNKIKTTYNVRYEKEIYVLTFISIYSLIIMPK